MARIRQDFGTLTLVMIPVAIALNIAVGQLIYALKIPLYMDSIGTVLVGVLAGPWAGALTGLLANGITGITMQRPDFDPRLIISSDVADPDRLFSEGGW